MSQLCPICHCAAAITKPHPTQDAYVVTCPVCSDFVISGMANALQNSFKDSERWRLSAWVRQYGGSIVTENDLQIAYACLPPTIKQRANRMLRWLNEKYPAGKIFGIEELGQWEAYINPPSSSIFFLGGELVYSTLVSIGWNRDVDEMQFMIAEVLCNELGHLVSADNRQYQISPKGLMHLEGSSNPESTIGFCAMWFSDEVKPLWAEVIEPAIRATGYEPLRIDSKQHNGKIDDEIMASIRGAKFVVADFTGNRGGVYYEAGFAHGLNLPVIFMCREGDDLHFDIRQYNCIFWKLDNLDDARERLKNRILATLGKGPLQAQ
jgi:hypothetical protein